MLADYAALRAAGRTVRLLIGPWGTGAVCTPASGCVTPWPRWTPRSPTARRSQGCGFSLLVPAAGPTCPAGLRRPATPLGDLQPAGRLADHRASAGPPSWFRYDPADPTPSVAGTAVGLAAGPADNRRLEARPDVLTFTSDSQLDDLEVIGPVRVRLYVQASVADIDLHARLCDVTARGRSINISDGIVRLTDVAPDTARPVEFDLWPIAHAFQRGHRIRLQVSGGAHPRYGRNLGTAESFATSTRLQASDRTVFHDAQHPSAVWLPVRS